MLEVSGVKIFLLDDVSIPRVLTIGNVLSTYYDREQGFGSASIEDGKAVINARAWGPESMLFKEVKRGETVVLLGKVKEFNGERYLSVLALRKLTDFNEELYWRAQHVKELASQGKFTSSSFIPFESVSEEKEEPVSVLENPNTRSTEESEETKNTSIMEEEILYASDFTRDNPEVYLANNAITIVRLLREHQQPLSIEEIVELTNLSLAQVQEAMEHLYEQGDIYEAEDGAWTVI